MKIKSIMIVAFMAVLAGCSGVPSETVMSEQIVQSTNKQFGVAFIEVKNLEKLNGREDGEKYIADVSYDVEFTKSSTEVGKAIGNTMIIEMVFGKFESGDSKHIDSQSFKFAQSENGWVLVDLVE